MSGLMVCPECPECSSREQKLRFDTDDDIGVILCGECDHEYMVVSVLANEQVRTVKDPMAGKLPEGVYYDLDDQDLLPPAANGGVTDR